MTAKTTVSEQPSSTAERILDAAEDLFAQSGYSATALADVADVVGIRTPSLYNHFKNKEALYGAVLDRLIESFSAPQAQLSGDQVTSEQLFVWLEAIVRQHHANPNLARLLQHAALSGGPHTEELIDRLFRPMFSSPDKLEGGEIAVLSEAGLQPWAVMAFNNLVMSYVTMAPMYRDVLGQDPFSERSLENQLNLIKVLLRAVLEYKGD